MLHALLLLQAARAVAPTPGVLAGTVFGRDGKPYATAQIVANVFPYGTLSKVDGRFALRLPTGKYRICVQAVGELPIADTVTLRAGGEVRRVYRFRSAFPGTHLHGCTPGEDLLVLSPDDTLLPVTTAEERDEILEATLKALNIRAFHNWRELFLSAAPADTPRIVRTILLPTSAPETGRWLYFAFGEGLLDGLCHSDTALDCPGTGLSRLLSLEEPRLVSQDSAIVHVTWVTTVPAACRAGDNVPYWPDADAFLFVRNDSGWQLTGRPVVWPETIGKLEVSDVRCPP